MPTVNPPTCIACNAYSIWTNFPEGEKVVKEKSYFDIKKKILSLIKNANKIKVNRTYI